MVPARLGVEKLPAGDVHADGVGRGRVRSVRCHSASCRQPSRSIAWPIGMIRPVSSASAMNSSGPTSPRCGCRQRASASNADDPSAADRHDRLVVHLEGAVHDGLAQIVLELQTGHGALAHRRIEDLARRSGRGPRAVQRRRRVPQNLFGGRVSGRADGDADAAPT